MSTPTCWYCPECGAVANGRIHHLTGFNNPCTADVILVALLVPGVDLPTLLREAGYDVREAWVYGFDSPPRETTAIGPFRIVENDHMTTRGSGSPCLVVVRPDEKPDWTAGIPMDQWPENQPGYEPGVLPDEGGADLLTGNHPAPHAGRTVPLDEEAT